MPSAIAFDDVSFESSLMQGLLFRSIWGGTNLGYHLQASDTNGNGVDDWTDFGARAAIETVFDAWAAVSGLTFFATTAANATLVETIENNSDRGALGAHFLPGGSQAEGEFNINGLGWTSSGLQPGGFGYITLLHEVGHALGLEHPFDDDLFPGVSGQLERGWYDLDQGVYSVMSYDDGWAVRGGVNTSTPYGFTATPMALDIAAIQAAYGANTTTNLGATSYALPGANTAGTFFSSIWDAGGEDEIAYDGSGDAFVFLGEATIDATATGGGLISHVEGIRGGYTIAQGAVIENARTGSGDDLVAGNDVANDLNGGAGADTLVGFGGDDVIQGGAGNDVIYGDSDLSTLDLSGYEVFTGASLPGGLGLGSGTAVATIFSSNATRQTAIDLTNSFAFGADADVLGGTMVHNVAVDGIGGGAVDYFRFTLTERSLVIVDIDGADGGTGAFDSIVSIQNTNGTEVGGGDDSLVVQGGSGSVANYARGGKAVSLDSYVVDLLDPGTYYIRVAQWADSEAGFTGIVSGGSYTMNLSVDGYVPASIPTDALGQLAYYYGQTTRNDIAEAAFDVGGTPSSLAGEDLGGPVAGKDDGHDHSFGLSACPCGCDHGRGGRDDLQLPVEDQPLFAEDWAA